MDFSYLLPKNKHDDSNIDRLYELSDCEIITIIPELLTWLQDINFPVAEKVADVLSYRYTVAEPYIIELLSPSNSDDIWKYWILDTLVPKFKDKLSERLVKAVKRIAESPTDGEKTEEVDIVAKELLVKINYDCMYRYVDRNERNNIVLHDCRVTSAYVKNNTLRFKLADGIFVKAESTYRMYYTDEAEIIFRLFYKNTSVNVDVYIFNYDEEKDVTLREEIEFQDFIDKINSGMELEFLEVYKGDNSMLFECVLWYNDDEIINRECVVVISAEDVLYCWNKIYIDK